MNAVKRYSSCSGSGGHLRLQHRALLSCDKEKTANPSYFTAITALRRPFYEHVITELYYTANTQPDFEYPLKTSTDINN